MGWVGFMFRVQVRVSHQPAEERRLGGAESSEQPGRQSSEGGSLPDGLARPVPVLQVVIACWGLEANLCSSSRHSWEEVVFPGFSQWPLSP